jgi:hypothetical protein
MKATVQEYKVQQTHSEMAPSAELGLPMFFADLFS